MISFAVMKLPRGLNAAYERSPLVQQNLDEFRKFRGAFKLIDPGAYRGIERCPLSEIPEPDPGWIHATPPNTLAKVDEGARQRLLEILGPTHECEHYPCSLARLRRRLLGRGELLHPLRLSVPGLMQVANRFH